MNEKVQLILDLIEEYITEKEQSKDWTPGKDWVQYSGPFFDASEYTSAVKSLLKGWLVLGVEGNKFESKFPPLLGKKYGLLTNSGSSSNLLMISALSSKRLYDLPKGSKILTPIAGFPTTINPIFQNGFDPVFVDISLDNLNLDLDHAERTLEQQKDIKAIIFAHVLGNPPDMLRLMHLVEKYNLILLEDCCDALGSKYDGKLLGSFGDMASCSFYPAHHITMGEGGFVAVNTPEQEKVVRSFREWGRGCYCKGKANMLENGTCKVRFSNWLPSLPEYLFDHKYVYEEVGYNLKPIELQAAMGLEQLKKMGQITRIRKDNYQKLMQTFEKYEEYFILPRPTQKSDPNWFAFPLTVKDGAPFNRMEFCKFLESKKIQTRMYFGGNTMLQPGYAHLMPSEDVIGNYSVARKVTTDTFFLGVSPVLTDDKITYVGNMVDEFMRQK